MPLKCYKCDGVVSCTEFGRLSLLVIVIAIVPLIISVAGGLHRQLSDLLRIWCRLHSQLSEQVLKSRRPKPLFLNNHFRQCFYFCKAQHPMWCLAFARISAGMCALLVCLWCAFNLLCRISLQGFAFKLESNAVVFRSLLRCRRTNEVRETAGSAISESRL